MTTERLKGKVAVVTGGGSGIGRGIVEAFMKEGAKVVYLDLKECEEKLGESCSCSCSFSQCDVSNEAQIEKGITTAVEKYGQLDIYVNCAGTGGVFTEIVDNSFENWDLVVRTNLNGTFFGIKHAGKQMKKQNTGGVILNISSLNSTVPNQLMASYCATKAAVDQLTRVAAMELGANGIRVCAINPGFTNTPMLTPLISVPEVNEEVIAKTPLGRYGQPQDIANAAVFLASEEASFITGTTLFVDGGQSNEGYPDVIPLMVKAMAGNK